MGLLARRFLGRRFRLGAGFEHFAGSRGAFLRTSRGDLPRLGVRIKRLGEAGIVALVELDRKSVV